MASGRDTGPRRFACQVVLERGDEARANERFSSRPLDRQREKEKSRSGMVQTRISMEECHDKDRKEHGLPRALTEAITDPDPTAARRAFDAMMTMRKIDIATIEAARRG